MEVVFDLLDFLLFAFNVSIISLLLQIELKDLLGITLDIIQINVKPLCDAHHSAMFDEVVIDTILNSIGDDAKEDNGVEYDWIGKGLSEVFGLVLARPENTLVQLLQLLICHCLQLVKHWFVEWINFQ